MRSLQNIGALVGVAVLMGCSEESRPTAPTPIDVEGTWRVLEYSPTASPRGLASDFDAILSDGESFVVFEEVAVHVLNARGIGWRREHVTTFQLDGAMEIDGTSYDVTRTGSELLLESESTRIRMRFENDALDPEAWIRDYESIRAVNSTDQRAGDLAWSDGAWSSGGPANRELVRIDPVTLTAFPRDLSLVSPTAITSVGGPFLVNDGTAANVFEVDPDTGNEFFRVTVAPGITALAYDGDVLWVVSRTTRRIYLVDYSNETVFHEIPYGDGVATAGGTFANEALYLVADGIVTAFEITRGAGLSRSIEPVGAFHLPGHEIVGVTHDGTQFWVTAKDLPTGVIRTHRIRPVP